MLRRLLVHGSQAIAGLAVGLVLAEGGFWLRDGGAFPHLNLYEADPALGVRLRPGAHQRIGYASNPISTVRIGPHGFRGEDWGAPASDEVIVVGDSQVFGLGVDDEQSTPSRLAAALGRPVRNAGVPTYGPDEYLAVIDRLLAERHPATVVLVFTMANDLFEVARPNVERHVVLDGWAVRSENAPESVDFPGRQLLFSRSHLVYAWRRWAHGPTTTDQGVRSEGSWDDVLAATVARETHLDVGNEEGEIAQQIQTAARDRRQLEVALDRALVTSDPEVDNDDGELALRVIRERRGVGDIVSVDLGIEVERSVTVTAELLSQGARLRREREVKLRAWVGAHPDDPEAGRVRRLLASEEDLDAQLASLSSRVAEQVGLRSPLAATVSRALASCTREGADLVVVVLPLDVQVSATEWGKYGEPERSMQTTLGLVTDLVRDSEAMGVRAIDPTSALLAAEPGAFLDRDFHLSPKGHEALATAIAAAITGPPPLKIPPIGLAPGRSRVPTGDEWQMAPENYVRGSTANHCTTREVREWLRVTCTRANGLEPLGVVVRDAPAEAMAYSQPGLADLAVPLLRGRAVVADFAWRDHADTLTVTWRDGRPKMGFVHRDPFEFETPEADAQLSPCFLEATRTDAGASFAADRCMTTPDCDAFVSCAQGDRTAMPSCGPGEANAGSAGWCLPLCDEVRPCARGVCTDWLGAGVCL